MCDENREAFFRPVCIVSWMHRAGWNLSGKGEKAPSGLMWMLNMAEQNILCLFYFPAASTNLSEHWRQALTLLHKTKLPVIHIQPRHTVLSSFKKYQAKQKIASIAVHPMYIQADNSCKTAARIPHPYTLGMMVGLFAVCDRWRGAAGGGKTAGLGSHLLFDSHSSDDVIQLLDGESCACTWQQRRKRSRRGARKQNKDARTDAFWELRAEI